MLVCSYQLRYTVKFMCLALAILLKGTSMNVSMSGWQRLQTFFPFSTQLFKNSQSIHAFSRCPQPWHFILSAN